MTSQINPNNINGAYPVAGQPNDTQGFRNNFTATKTNFQYAANEITELQNKAVLKEALTGTTLDNNMGGNPLYNFEYRQDAGTVVQLVTTSGTVTLDWSAASFQVLPSTTGSITLAFANWPLTGKFAQIVFRVTISNIAYTVTLPASVSLGTTNIQGLSGSTITFSNTGTYEFLFETLDGGTTISIESGVRPISDYTNIVTIANTTPSTSTSTGALTVAGGVGVSGNVYAGRFYGDGSYLSNIYPNYLFNGTSYMGFGASNGNANISVGATSNVVVVSSTTVVVGGTGGVSLIDSGTVGYGAGAGGTQSQSGNKSGTVILNKPSGEITMQNTALNAATIVSFTLTNSTIANTDLLVINHVSGGTVGAYTFAASCGTGSATIYVRNATAGSLSEAIVLRFAVIKGATT